VTQSVDTLVNGVIIDVTANDTDANPNDAGHFWIFGLTQPVDSHGNPVGSVSIETDANGHQVIRFYDPTPDDSQAQTLTFTYRVGDQWATSDPATWANTVSAPVTASVTISGNSAPAETLTATSDRGSVVTGHNGNDLVLGGEGKDTLIGGAGADTLVGDEGKDSLSGGAGNDRLYGGGHVFHYEHGDDHRITTPIPGLPLYYVNPRGGDDDGANTLNGGAGDDTLTGGGENDRFVFDYGFGHDVITDFHPRGDKIVVDHNMWGTFADLKAHAAQVGTSVVLTSDFDGYTITLQNMKLASLYSGDFIIT
jgi:Ca2+-binding RTX toxin-like protein